jgi:hypothetical protein
VLGEVKELREWSRDDEGRASFIYKNKNAKGLKYIIKEMEMWYLCEECKRGRSEMKSLEKQVTWLAPF